MNFNNLAQGKHSSHILKRSMEQEDECHETRSIIKVLTSWKKVNKSPPSPFKTKTIMGNSQDNEGSTRTVKNIKIRRTKRW
jgi:hypothetical protein